MSTRARHSDGAYGPYETNGIGSAVSFHTTYTTHTP